MNSAAKVRGRFRRFLVRIIALAIVACALVISLAKLALPWLAAHPEVVQKNLSAWLHADVKIDGVQSDWQVRPKLKVRTLTIGANQSSGTKTDGLNIENAEIELDPFGFVPGRRWVQDLSVMGAQLTLAQTSAGWQLEGLGHREAVTLSNAQRLALLNSVGQLSIRNATITVRPLSGKLSHFDGVSLILRRQGEVLRAGLQFSAPTRNGLAARGRIALRALWLERTGTLTLYGETVATTLDDLHDFSTLFSNADVGNGLQSLAGTLDSKLWLTLTDNKPSQGYAKISTLDARQQPTMNLEFGSRNGHDWLGALSLPNMPTKALGLARLLPDSVANTLPFAATLEDSGAISIVAGHANVANTDRAGIDLSAFSQAAGAHLALEQARTLAEFALSGKLIELRAQFGPKRPWRAEIQAQALNILPNGHIPGVSNADIQFKADAQAASLTLTGNDFVLNAPISFRKPIHVEKISLNAALWPAPTGWSQGYSAEVSDIALSAPGYDATAFASLEKNAEEVPQFFVTLDVSRGDIAYAGQFWAIDKMPPKVIAWLDTALIRGQTGRARAVYRGPLKRLEFPFRQAQGRFEAAFELNKAEIKFAPDWPAIQIAAGDFSLINDSLVAHQGRGQIAGNPITSLTGGIARFTDPVAQFQITGGNDAAALLALLRASPIGRDFGSNFSGLSASGDTKVALKLSLPLRPDLGERVVDGNAVLRQSSLHNPDWRLNLSALDGQIVFDRQGFTAKNLVGVQNALPIALSAAVGASHTGAANVVIDASLSGEMEPSLLFGQEAVLAPILAKISGTSQWDVRVRTVSGATGKSLTTTELSSDLKGVTIDLPAPLGKRAQTARALRFSLPSEESSQRALVLEIAGGVRFIAELGREAVMGPGGIERAAREFRGTLVLGAQGSQNAGALDDAGGVQNASALPKAGLRIIGKLDELNFAEWAALVGSTANAAGSVRLAGVNLQAARLTGALAQFPGAMRLSATPSAQGWKVKLDSTAASGQITWRTDLATQAITAQFTHLYLPASEATPPEAALELEKAHIQIDPRAIPTLHLYVEDLNVGSAKLGATRWESFPTPKGMRIDLLESKSSDLTLTGSGDWQGIGAQGLSSFKLRFSAQDLGRMLAGLGFSGHVAGGQTLAEIDADWPGAPIEFALARLHGGLNVWVGSGRFLELDPGAGRLFGLLSVRELPRRLALDFRDFFQTGMSFTEIRGDFSFDAGNAYTDGLKIKAPAADITVIGRTGLSARDYDQTALVKPKIGVLPMVGAIAGGPAGAAAGLLAQRVLEGESALAAKYKITGSWENPVVTKQSPTGPIKPDAPELAPR